MKVKVKVIAIDLIGRLGGVFIEMDVNTAQRYRNKGQVKILDEVIEYDYPDIDDGSVLTLGEDEETDSDLFKRVPAHDEPIFSQIAQ